MYHNSVLTMLIVQVEHGEAVQERYKARGYQIQNEER